MGPKPTKTAKPPKATLSTLCIRCPTYNEAATSGHGDDLAKCINQLSTTPKPVKNKKPGVDSSGTVPPKHTADTLWWDFPKGPNSLDLSDVEACRELLQLAKNAGPKLEHERNLMDAEEKAYFDKARKDKHALQFRGVQVTTRMLEQAAQTSHHAPPSAVDKGKKKAVGGAAVSSGLDAGGSQKDQSVSKGKGKGPAHLSNTDQETKSDSNLKTSNVSPPPWKEVYKYPNGLEGPEDAMTFDKAVWSDCPANIVNDKHAHTASPNAAGRPTRVITNYIVVEKVPEQLYEYSVKYVVSNKKSDTVKGSGSAVNPGKVTKNTFPALGDIANALPAAGQSDVGPQGAEQPEKTRNVTRRTEQRCVFDAMKGQPPFAARQDWATDFNTVWALEPLDFNGPGNLPAEGQIYTIDNLVYHKSTGQQAILSRVEFTFIRKLVFHKADATPNEVLTGSDIVNAKGTSVHVAALNGLISKHATELQSGTITQVGANKFFLCKGFESMGPEGSKIPPLNAHRGYFSSIRPGREQVLLNISAKAGAFFNPMRLSTWLKRINDDIFNEYGTDRGKLLVGRTVRICYDRAVHDNGFDPNAERNRHKTVASIGGKPHEEKFLNQKTGRMMSVEDYYVKELHAKPKDLQQSLCINVGLASRFIVENGQLAEHPDTKGKQLWIPSAYLELDPDQPFNRGLCPAHMEAMLHAAQHPPAETQFLIAKEGLKTMGLDQPAGLATLGLVVRPELLDIPARMLEAPRIAYANGVVTANGATWSLVNRGANCGFRGAASDINGAVHVADFTNDGIALKTSVGQDLTKRLRDHGIAYRGFENSQAVPKSQIEWGCEKLGNINDEELKDNIVELRTRWKNPDLLLVVLHDENSDNYARVKRVFDQVLGVHSICLRCENFRRGVVHPSILSNLALKANMKFGGQNHEVRSNNTSAFASIAADTIVLGADVSHAPSQMAFCPSVASVVGNIDKQFANFPGSMRLQACGQEFIEDLAEMVEERVLAYADKNDALPKQMIFYRDGVGEDQFATVKADEIPSVTQGYDRARSAFEKQKNLRADTTKLKLTFIVVGKRHNTRFFCRDENQTNTSKKGQPSSNPHQIQLLNGNPKPGLLVDTVITRPNAFFLQSHEALQGTAKSGHYTILEPGALTTASIQHLTHAFCYNYARATKGVSYVGPAYYADRLCERGTMYLKAYTKGKSEPVAKMDEQEKKDKKEGARRFGWRVVEEVEGSVLWNPRVDDSEYPGRKNPWHPDFDKCMFWL